MKKEITVAELAEQSRAKHFPIKYKGYVIEVCDRETLVKEQGKIIKKIFPSMNGYKTNKKEDKELTACFLEYRKIHSERFLIKKNNKVIGWFQGEMEDFETFYMRNTGILPDHQNKGIYQKFLSIFESYIFDLGYARISSHHSPVNGVILSLKLKSKYVIVGEETHERWGKLVKLVKFKNSERYNFY